MGWVGGGWQLRELPSLSLNEFYSYPGENTPREVQLIVQDVSELGYRPRFKNFFKPSQWL